MENEILGGKYEIEASLGSGGSSQVYLTKKLTTQERYAIKVIATDDSQAIRLAQRETETLKRLKHRNIVDFFEEGYDSKHKCAYLVLEYLKGQKIKDYFNNGVSLVTKLNIFLQILEALSYAHSKEVIHRDMKPDNIMVVDIEDTPIAKVLDFGISAVTTTILTRTISSYHTPLFSPPEQINCQGVFVDSDTYSLSMTILYLLASHQDRIYFQDERNKEILYQSASQTLGSDNPLCQLLIEILKDATDAERKKRPRLDEIRKALSQIIDSCTESTSIVFVITSGLREQISESNAFGDNGLKIKRYLESKLINGISTLHIRKIRNSQNDRIRVEVGHEKTYAVFHGFIKLDDPNKIILYSERDISPIDAEMLFENGLAVKTSSQINISNANEKGSDLTDLIEQLNLKERIANTEREDRANINSLFFRWQNVIDLESQIIDERKKTFESISKKFEPSSQCLSVVLREPISIEEFNQITSPPLPVTISIKGKGVRGRDIQRAVGSINDGEKSKTEEKIEKLYINLSDFSNPETIAEVADQGKVETNFKAQESEIGRRRKALRSIRYKDSENASLSSIIVDPSSADVFEPIVIDRFFDEQLDESQRKAVSKALATEDIFLIQGPPGTGKTSVITEIIRQILQKHSTHKILISSQSNVAVDNVLCRLAGILIENKEIRLLRVGREEKIEEEAKQFEIEKAIMDWQHSICYNSARSWQKREASHENILSGVKRISDVETLLELREKRHKISRDLLENVSQFNKDLLITDDSEISSTMAFEALDRIDERIQVDTNILEKIKFYVDKFGVEYPNNKPFSKWIEEEYDRLKNLLGDGNENYVRFLKLKTLYDEWNQRLSRKQVDLVPLFLDSVNVIGATCLGSAKLKEVVFDWVIIDEAGRSTAPETFVPMVKGKKTILVGDHKQLPPIIDRELQSRALTEQDISKRVLETSLFEYLYEELPNPKKITLSHQYRMHPDIGNLVSTLFYENKVSSERVDKAKKEHNLPNFVKSIYWISTSDNAEKEAKEKRIGTSYTNSYEARLIRAVVQQVQESCQTHDQNKDIGIIAGYASQVGLLETVITPHDKSLWRNLNISIHTVDAFQGGECDVIIYDLVRNNSKKQLGFTSDQRRLNVALSRAKQLLIIVGNDVMAYDGKTPQGQINPFTDLIEYIDNSSIACDRINSQLILQGY